MRRVMPDPVDVVGPEAERRLRPSPVGAPAALEPIRGPGHVLTDVAPELDLTGALLSPGDRDGTAFGLTTVTAGVFTPYLVDVNLPAHPFPFSFGVAAGERANVALVFLPPDN